LSSFTSTLTTAIYTLSLHDALPIFPHPGGAHHLHRTGARPVQDERRHHRRSPRHGRAVGTASPDRTSAFPARDPAAASTALVRPVSELLIRVGPTRDDEGRLPLPYHWAAAR